MKTFKQSCEDIAGKARKKKFDIFIIRLYLWRTKRVLKHFFMYWLYCKLQGKHWHGFYNKKTKVSSCYLCNKTFISKKRGREVELPTHAEFHSSKCQEEYETR